MTEDRLRIASAIDADTEFRQALKYLLEHVEYNCNDEIVNNWCDVLKTAIKG